MKKYNCISILFVIIIICLPLLSIAQEPSFGDDVSDVPVDGGLSLLVAAGVGYGTKKLKEKRKQSLHK